MFGMIWGRSLFCLHALRFGLSSCHSGLQTIFHHGSITQIFIEGSVSCFRLSPHYLLWLSNSLYIWSEVPMLGGARKVNRLSYLLLNLFCFIDENSQFYTDDQIYFSSSCFMLKNIFKTKFVTVYLFLPSGLIFEENLYPEVCQPIWNQNRKWHRSSRASVPVQHRSQDPAYINR